MRIVVVEQEAALGQFLARALQTEEDRADWVSDGETALECVDRFGADLMVLDLLLPKLSGLEVLERMRQFHNDCSVIALMAEDSAEARVRCLNLGADDCVIKPFSLQELVARCRAHLRRRTQLNGAILQHGSLVLRRRDRTVSRDGISIELTSKEFMLLEHLMERRGRCVSRAELLRSVFQQSEGSDTNVVEVYINYVRRKLSLGNQPGAQPIIETIRGSGYRIADVRTLENSGGRKPMLKAVSL